MFVRVDIDFAIFAQEQPASVLEQLRYAIERELSRRLNGSPEPDETEREWLRKGNKLMAVKVLRERTGLSLRESLDAVTLYEEKSKAEAVAESRGSRVER